MSRLSAIIACLIAFSCVVSAQGSDVDSVIALLKKDKEDTNKIKHLHEVAYDLYTSNPDSTILLAKEAAELSVKIHSPFFEATSYGIEAVGYYAKTNYASAIEFFMQLKRFI